VTVELTFWYEPVGDLQAAAASYYALPRWKEAWREGDETIAFHTPDRAIQLMLSSTEQPAGPVYLVPDLAAWTVEHLSFRVAVSAYDLPGGSVCGFHSPGGVLYTFGQRHDEQHQQ
jgi:hypothetical protein